MTPKNESPDRDEVLYAFHEACERPTAEEIIAWVRRYPQFAEDIRAHAAVARDLAAGERTPAPEPDESMLARGFSRVLNALYNAETEAAEGIHNQPCETFLQMMSAAGTDVPKLARELDIGRSVLADLVNGMMLAPMGPRLLSALSAKFGRAEEAVARALDAALKSPRLGHAKANQTPTVRPRPYEQIIRESGMSAERVRYWLAEED
jgi:hypothetical protein